MSLSDADELRRERRDAADDRCGQAATAHGIQRSVSGLAVDRSKQAAGGLGIEEQIREVRLHCGVDVNPRPEVLPVRPPSARRVPPNEVEGAREEGDHGRVDLQRTSAGGRHL